MSRAALAILSRLGNRDRALLRQWALPEDHSVARRWSWMVLTQLGSAGFTVAVALLIPLVNGVSVPRLWQPAAALTLSHLIVQALKRFVQRERPLDVPVIACPDKFSFPSGHATSSLALGWSVGLLYPVAMPLLLPLALAVGWSRVVLGVHYPGDVLAGQGIAAVTMIVLQL